MLQLISIDSCLAKNACCRMMRASCTAVGAAVLERPKSWTVLTECTLLFTLFLIGFTGSGFGVFNLGIDKC